MIRLPLLILFVLFPFVALAQESSPGDRVLPQLKELEPLPKVHYSWPVPFKSMSDELLFEYVRLTSAVSISGEWSNSDEVARAVKVCKQVNETKPKTPASIGINYSVWHRRFGKDLPPTDVGPTHQAELDYLRDRMTTIRDQLRQQNAEQNANVAASAILFDSEHFHTKPSDAQWNKALTEKYNAAYDIAREIFPDVRIEWYGRGSVQPSASPTGWTESTYFALDEKGASFGCSLYQVPEIGYTRDIFRKTVENAAKHGCDEVTPWIALASGYRRKTDKFHEFELEWNYDLIYSWKLGAEVNHAWFGAPERNARFAPWNKAQVAIFYPEPFGRTPKWPEHFVAYVRGAHLVKELPE